jgi:hypothetical protein
MKQLLYIILLLFIFQAAIAQEPPPRPLKITVNQNLSFGAFYHGAGGGTVTVKTDLSRIASGDVVLLTMGYPFSPAIYTLTGTPGRIVSFLNPGEITLAGSNGGSLKLNLGTSNPASPFVLTSTPLSLYIEGILTDGPPASNPPGNFSGSFNITLMQE